jgi:hypothetical protein
MRRAKRLHRLPKGSARSGGSLPIGSGKARKSAPREVREEASQAAAERKRAKRRLADAKRKRKRAEERAAREAREEASQAAAERKRAEAKRKRKLAVAKRQRKSAEERAAREEASPVSGSAREQPRRKWARCALDEVYPNGVPSQKEVPNPALVKAVTDLAKRKGWKVGGTDSILRAARRRK